MKKKKRISEGDVRSVEQCESYNLVDQPWIPVLYLNGRNDRVGILDAMRDAHRIREIAAPNPMDRLAVVRLLIALKYWLRGKPEGRRDTSAADVDRLVECRQRFEILGNGPRFFQADDVSRIRTVTELLQEVPTGNNFWHFRHSTDGDGGLCIPCCILGLLRLPLFSVSGLPDMKAGINGTPPIYRLPLGETLADTLELNWQEVSELGTPSWESPWDRLGPPRLLEGLTSLSRRVRLHTPIGTSDACLGCGAAPGLLVLTCGFESAGMLQDDRWTDPHVSYREVRGKTGETPRRSLPAADATKPTFRYDRPWDELASEVARILCDSKSVGRRGAWVVGFATDQAKNIDVWERKVWLAQSASHEPHGLSSTAAIGVGELAKRWDKACRQADDRIMDRRPHARGTGVLSRQARQAEADAQRRRRRARETDVVSPLAAFRPDVEHRVSQRMVQLIFQPTDFIEWARNLFMERAVVAGACIHPGTDLSSARNRRRCSTILPTIETAVVTENDGTPKTKGQRKATKR